MMNKYNLLHQQLPICILLYQYNKIFFMNRIDPFRCNSFRIRSEKSYRKHLVSTSLNETINYLSQLYQTFHKSNHKWPNYTTKHKNNHLSTTSPQACKSLGSNNQNQYKNINKIEKNQNNQKDLIKIKIKIPPQKKKKQSITNTTVETIDELKVNLKQINIRTKQKNKNHTKIHLSTRKFSQIENLVKRNLNWIDKPFLIQPW